MEMKTKLSFEVIVAEHYGMCFGVKAAIEDAERVARERPVTILGRLAHNPSVQDRMMDLGARAGELDHHEASTEDVLITAHGASDRDRDKWHRAGHVVTDTTCPLVHKAHAALRDLVSGGYSPVVIGKRDHVEVRGLTGDFPGTQVVLSPSDVEGMQEYEKLGIISQTTQPTGKVATLVGLIQSRFPRSEVQFIDTVCRPTKERQQALLDLCAQVELVIVVGGNHSNNTRELAETCRRLGCQSRQVEKPDDIDVSWFSGVTKVGVTAGTSTPDEDVSEVTRFLSEMRTC